MLNLALGSPRNIDGRTCILTHAGLSGHAIYGPYKYLEPGHYVVEFNLEAPDLIHREGGDDCAQLDVASDHGRRIHASKDLTLSSFREGRVCMRLPFHADQPGTYEFRVRVTGRIPLLVDDYCPLSLIATSDQQAGEVRGSGFPNPRETPGLPGFFIGNQAKLRQLYEHGAAVKIVGDAVVVSINGISFNAAVIDDLRFVDEIFFRSTYNFSTPRDCCVIDIGMNIGLVALTFAKKATVKEVHSFEPFVGTFARAAANLRLNPDLANKILAYNYGLADRDDRTTILIDDYSDSGCLSIRGSGSGQPEQITVQNAAAVLRPIIASARAKGRDIIAKIDCEGSEFAIFRTLEEHGMLAEFTAFMVEWHRIFDGKTQHDLIAPLVRQGFVVFDQSGSSGNGFFYAVRAHSAYSE